jgi:ATP-dependent helicase/nuclease subunit B
MTAIIVSSVSSQRRIGYARAWLDAQTLDRELLLVGVTLDGANELARQAAKAKGAAFGWHRLSISQLVAAIAAPALAVRGLVPLSRIATEAIVIRIVQRLKAEGKVGRYQLVSEMPGFARAISGVIAELRLAGLRSSTSISKCC